MAEPRSRRGRPKSRKEDLFVIQVRVGRALKEALDELAARTRRTKNAELELALERHLADAGLWPPPAG